MRVERARMDLVILGRALRQDSSYPNFGGIDLNNELTRRIRINQYGRGGKEYLKSVESTLSNLRPNESDLGRGESSKRGGNLAKVSNKAPIKICKS